MTSTVVKQVSLYFLNVGTPRLIVGDDHRSWTDIPHSSQVLQVSSVPVHAVWSRIFHNDVTLSD